MGHRFIQLPFHAIDFGVVSPTRVTVVLPAISAEVELLTGTVTVQGATPQRASESTREPAAALEGVELNCKETDLGPVSTLLRGEKHAQFMGEVRRAFCHGDNLVVTLQLPGNQVVCRALVLGESSEQALSATYGAVVHGHGELAACAMQEMMHVFRFTGSRVQAVSVALPHAYTVQGPRLWVHEDTVWALCGDKLVGIDTRLFEFGEPGKVQSLECAQLAGEAGGDDECATVVFVLAESILLDHPRLKRLRVHKLSGDPEVAKGDRIKLTDVREELPGIHRVHAWHKAEGPRSERPPAQPLVLSAPHSPLALDSSTAAASRKEPLDSALLTGLSARHRFRVAPLLLRLLRLRESDLVFRRWLDRLGLDCFGVRGLARDWDADPNLVAFCGLGSGDEYALYVYPPWCAEGREPAVVEFLHETNFVEFRALTFDAFLDDELELRAGQDSAGPDLVRRVRERLGFPREVRPCGDAPAWLPREAEPVTAPPPGRLLRVFRRSDPLEDERSLLLRYLRSSRDAPENERLRAELGRVYAKLGWTLALQHLHDPE